MLRLCLSLCVGQWWPGAGGTDCGGSGVGFPAKVPPVPSTGVSLWLGWFVTTRGSSAQLEVRSCGSERGFLGSSHVSLGTPGFVLGVWGQTDLLGVFLL